MSLNGILDLAGSDPAIRHLLEGARSSGMVHKVSALDAARPFLVATLWHHLRVPMLIIVPRPEDARRLHDDLTSYLGEDDHVHLFPEPDVLPFERLVADAATNNQRMQALAAINHNPVPGSRSVAGTGRPPLVVASTAAALRKTISPEVMTSETRTLAAGEKVRLGELFSRWVELGYEREDGVEIPGSFSQRGGIVDVFPPSSPQPVRIELLGDEIESIRPFNPASQRSVGQVDQVTIVPAREILPSMADRDLVSRLIGKINFTRCTPATKERFEEEMASLFSGRTVEELPLYNGLLNHSCLIDHLPGDGLLVLDRDGEIETESLALGDREAELRRGRESRGELPANFPSPQLSWDEFRSLLETRRRLLVQGWSNGEGGFLPASFQYGRLGDLGSRIREMQRAGDRVVVVTRHVRRLAEVMEDSGSGAVVHSGIEEPPPPGSLTLLSGKLREGWRLPMDGGDLTLLTDSEIFGVTKERRAKPRTPVKRAGFLSELAPGGYVVHIDHGVARFSGTIQMGSDGEQKEYLVLEYAERDKLYVPTDHLDRVSPYKAPNDQYPGLTRLGGAEWSRVKERVKNSAREMAHELLDLYASRQVIEGHAFPPDSAWETELADSFPYEETEDQERTIREVKGEMEQLRPMDRLVCGDVGYGKTEVALRAAFKTVNDGMQAGILVPTTVLAQQHYATFSERLSPYPVRVEVFSRFRTKKEQREVLEGLKLGTIDVVIGTHRLLQRDVKFKNLGLVIVDEEQRFGVDHKERLKRLRREVDMLALSATPIPRTLYMGLSGIRDMSTMETPPEERLPVKTYVSEYSDDLIKEAIQRELERGGQVFFLHNRVQTIRRVTDGLAKLVPQARLAMGHGRMGESELEAVMVAFANGDVDVLVCTTIIESGLDIPNANTLIIDRADRFGLSQIYQLRGRVGRGGHRAHTYLLIPRGRRITDSANKRLKAILDAAELGAGFRIAMRDLEIRGAGNILGSEQSGHIHAVGFDLYTHLLNEVVAEIKSGDGGGAPVDAAATDQTRVSLPVSAHIPESYIAHLPTRLAIYQRLTRVRDRAEVHEVREELRDRFGSLPSVVENLLYLVDLKHLAREAGVEAVTQSGTAVVLSLVDDVGGARLAVEKALGRLAKVGNQQIHLSMRLAGDGWQEDLVKVLESLMAFREQVASVVASA